MVADVFGIGGIAKATGEVVEKELDNQAVRAKERETTHRMQIQAARDIIQQQQKEFSKRHATIGRTEQTWINQSDETLNALDRVFQDVQWRKNRKNFHTRLSVMSLIGMGPIIYEMGVALDNQPLANVGRVYSEHLKTLVDHAPELNRLANAGDLNFAIPAEIPGLIETGSFFGPTALTPFEKETAVEKVTGKTIDQVLPTLPGTPPIIPLPPSLLPPPQRAATIDELSLELAGLQQRAKEAIGSALSPASPGGIAITKAEKQILDNIGKQVNDLKVRIKGMQKQAMEGVEGHKAR